MIDTKARGVIESLLCEIAALQALLVLKGVCTRDDFDKANAKVDEEVAQNPTRFASLYS